MGRQIIKQPNNLYCVFSTIVNNLVYANMTESDILKEYQSEFGKIGYIKAKNIIEELKKGENPYRQFTMTFNEMMELIKGIHGEKEYNNLLSDMNINLDK